MNTEKIRFQMRISQDTDRKIREAMERENCRSKNEFVEKALRFYCDYLAAGDISEFLPPIIVETLRGLIHDTENRLARLLFKNAVELDMMMNVLAAGLEIADEDLQRLRGKCVQDVKRTNGAISLRDAVDYQKGL